MLHIKKIRPLFTSIVTTGERYTEDEYDQAGLVITATAGDLKTYQRVLAVGSSVRDIKVGDLVMINVMNYAVKKYDPNSVKEDMGMNKVVKFAFNWVIVDDEQGNPQNCLLLNDRDILFAFEGEEEKSVKSSIILPKKPEIIS